MKPYYSEDGITIYHGDCRDVLPLVDYPMLRTGLVTDPPYGIAYDASHSKYRNGIDRGDAWWDKEPFDPSVLIDLKLPSIIWGGNCFASRLPDRTSWITWVKIARQDVDIRQSDCELAWTNCLGRNRVFFHLWIGAYRDSESGLANWHPCQKPEAPMRWCVERLPIGLDVILDPFMGSGTTLRAAKDLGRKAIGIEIEEKYCEIAAKRLSQKVLNFA